MTSALHAFKAVNAFGLKRGIMSTAISNRYINASLVDVVSLLKEENEEMQSLRRRVSK